MKPESLGPTSNPTAQHSLRVYHQVQEWMGRHLPPEEYGMFVANGKIMPIKMMIPPAP